MQQPDSFNVTEPSDRPESLTTARMDPAIKAKWVAALRSGEYKQARGTLRTFSNAFCCLGVLCNLHAQAHPKIAAKQREGGTYMGSDGLPPMAVIRWAGLADSWGGNVEIGGYVKELSRHNDAGRTFAEIAAAIEEQL